MVRRGASTDDEDNAPKPSRVKKEKMSKGSPRGAKRARVNEAGDDVVRVEEDAGAEQDDQPDQEEEQEQEQGGQEREDAPSERVKTKTLPRDVDGYIPGSIVRIKLHNFVTYDDVEFSPGPYLNMILGPNGTGKSSIACAICLGLNWSPAVLGRAAEISSFVKLGAETGFIEIELKGPAGQDNIVIRRGINSKNRASSFTLNGSHATGNEVTNQVAQLNVQVGNLCSFLPQDKVSSFAAMSPTGLLKETENAAGDARLRSWHETLIDHGKLLKTQKESLEKDVGQKSQLEERNNQIERDVQRYNERKQIETNIALLNVRIPVERYREKRREWMQLKEQKQVLHKKAVNLKTRNEPAHQHLEDLERQCVEKDDEHREHRKIVQKAGARAKKAKDDLFKADTDQERLITELGGIKSTEDQRQKTIKNLESQIRAVQTQRDEHVVPDEDEAALRAEQRAIKAAFQKTNYDADKHAHDQKQREMNEKRDALRRKGDAANNDLHNLNNIEHRKLQNYKQYDPAGYEAVNWLRGNKTKFRMEVFEPPFLSVSVPDPSFATQVEMCFTGPSMKMFVCQCQEDYNTLNRALNDNPQFTQGGKRRIPTWFRPGAGQEEMPAPLTHEQLLGMGANFDGYALDFVKCPDGLKFYLQKELGLHRIAISRRGIPAAKLAGATDALMRGTNQNVIFDGKTRHETQRSRYGNREMMSSSGQLRDARYFSGNNQVNPQEKQRIESILQECRQEKDLLDEEAEELPVEAKKLAERMQAHQKEIKDVESRINELKQSLQRKMSLDAKYNKLKSDLAAKRALGNGVELAAKIRRQLFKLAKERSENGAKFLDAARDVLNAQINSTLASLEALQINANKTAFKELVDVKDAKYQQALAEFEKIEGQVKQVRDVAGRLKDESTTALNEISADIKPQYEEIEQAIQEYQTAADAARKAGQEPPEPAEELKPKLRTALELEQDLETEQNKLDMNRNTNPGVVEQYERRKQEIETLTDTIESKQRQVDKLERNIQRIRDQWEPALRDLVSSIGKKFSAAFDRIGCAGEIRVREEEAYENWAIDILVKFRDTEKLQLLTAHRQSGGERSLTTILYLMSLTEEARAPFSLVDEINQGMDQRAERIVHNSMVDVTCKPDSAQYFLITPKLLPDLEYHERMRVLCVNNGEWLPEDGGTGNMMSMIDAYVAKNPR
ncbi:Purine nucleoside phosphorylase [Mycena kentingensis (nom. inval.)]|nr:Purine nucleoside phosphorylase [Mycena kentingensis (nom. inval.)]